MTWFLCHFLSVMLDEDAGWKILNLMLEAQEVSTYIHDMTWETKSIVSEIKETSLTTFFLALKVSFYGSQIMSFFSPQPSHVIPLAIEDHHSWLLRSEIFLVSMPSRHFKLCSGIWSQMALGAISIVKPTWELGGLFLQLQAHSRIVCHWLSDNIGTYVSK